VKLPDDHRDRMSTIKLPSPRSSLLIDLQFGKRIEVEALQGSVVRRGANGRAHTDQRRSTPPAHANGPVTL
jgi:ketopantoate reductase